MRTASSNAGGDPQVAGRHGRWVRHGNRVIVLLDSPLEWDGEQELANSYGDTSGSTAVRTATQRGVYRENFEPAGGWESVASVAPISAPVHFEFPPPAGCPALTEAQYRGILRQAVMEAIRLANNAASKLEAATAFAPDGRDKDARETARLFTFFFCHDPSLPVPWANNEASGGSVAKRLRAIARELGGGRRITFRCDPHCNAGERAHTNQNTEPNVINLCALFWNPPPGPGLPAEGFRAGVILHEMLHVLFTDFFHHDPEERKRNNAHCYRAFILRAGGYGQDLPALDRCTGRPC